MNQKKFGRFGHDRKSGVDLNFFFCGFHFYYWTPWQDEHKFWLYFLQILMDFFTNERHVYLSGTFRMSTRAELKSRPDFGHCLSVEDTWPPTKRDHILLMENPKKEGNLILGMSQRCYGKFKFLDLNRTIHVWILKWGLIFPYDYKQNSIVTKQNQYLINNKSLKLVAFHFCLSVSF